MDEGSSHRLEDYCPPRFYAVLAREDSREAYWAVIARAFHRKFFSGAVALTQPEAIDIAEDVLISVRDSGMLIDQILSLEDLHRIPELDDDTPGQGPYRRPARNLLKNLVDARWFILQSYADQEHAVVEFTRVGHKQAAHMLRDMRGEHLPLVSFADRLFNLVGNRCNAMLMTPGRLRQLREVVGQMNERIHELLGTIKEQAEHAILRGRTVRAILRDLLIEFEKHVGYDYALLKRRESPPRLWDAVMQAMHELRQNQVWLHDEAEWYREQETLSDLSAGMTRVIEDMTWISNVMNTLSAANMMLDQRYARYVGTARKRIEAQLNQSHDIGDGIAALLEEAAANRHAIEPVVWPKVTTIAPIGFTYNRGRRDEIALVPVLLLADMDEDQARAARAAMDDSIPIHEVCEWLGARNGEGIVIAVDDLPLETEQDYLSHMFAAYYASERRDTIRFVQISCNTGPSGCASPGTCDICSRRANGFRVPRGTFTAQPRPDRYQIETAALSANGSRAPQV